MNRGCPPGHVPCVLRKELAEHRAHKKEVTRYILRWGNNYSLHHRCLISVEVAEKPTTSPAASGRRSGLVSLEDDRVYPLMTASGASIVLYTPDPLLLLQVEDVRRTGDLHARFSGQFPGVFVFEIYSIP